MFGRVTLSKEEVDKERQKKKKKREEAEEEEEDDEEAEEDEKDDEKDELADVSKEKKTKEGYLKDGFVVEEAGKEVDDAMDVVDDEETQLKSSKKQRKNKPPNILDYGLSSASERDRYNGDVEEFKKTNPDVSICPFPNVLKPEKEAFNLREECQEQTYLKQAFAWNQVALEINTNFGTKLPILDDDIDSVSGGKSDMISSITRDGSDDEDGDVEEIISDDENPDKLVWKKTTIKKKTFKKGDIKIPERFLDGNTIVTFKGQRSNSSIIISEQQDYYATPQSTTALIIRYLEKYHSTDVIWDCTDGNGEMSGVFKEAGFTVQCTDFYTKKEKVDYLCDTPPFE